MKVGDLVQMKACDCCAGRPGDDVYGIVTNHEINKDFNPPLQIIWVMWADIGLDWIVPKDKHFEVINEERITR